MSDGKSSQIAIRPVISYPHRAELGRAYLMTIDLQLVGNGETLPANEEEWVFHCLLSSSPMFVNEPLGEPAVVLHRFGGTYGPARFMLTAANELGVGAIQVTLVNDWGMPVASYSLDGIEVVPRSDGSLPEAEVVRHKVQGRRPTRPASLHTLALPLVRKAEQFPTAWISSEVDLREVAGFDETIRKRLADYWIIDAADFVTTARSDNGMHGSGLKALAVVLKLSDDVLRELLIAAEEALVEATGAGLEANDAST